MKFFAALVAVIAAAVAVDAQSPTFTNCATSPELAINTFTLTPYPLCINQNVCASGTGTLSVPVTQGATLSII
ncbi:hypothetical protein BGZ49_005171, partial [Haplosporangium sp. Z 27]